MGILSGLSNKLKSKTAPLVAAEPRPSYQALMAALATVHDPDLHADIVSLGFVRNLRWEDGGRVVFELHLTTPACPVKEELRAQCEAALRAVPGVQGVEVQLAAGGEPAAASGAGVGPGATAALKKAPAAGAATGAGQVNTLARVRHIIAVASGKGGVGKSTTAVNLAFAMAKAGARVGLLDADVYGPSLAKMTGVGDPQAMAGNLVVPPEVDGVKIISVAMFAEANKAQILRGPMAGNLVKQFLTQVAWGELDYLVIDYPPGTGDIQLTISQSVSLTGAVMVTTPQEVALLDVRKAMTMFATMKVPLLGVVETMSYFICDGCDKRHHIFKSGGGRALVTSFGIPLLGEIPLDPRVCESGENGKPVVAAAEPTSVGEAYQAASQRLVRELAIVSNKTSGALSSFALTWKE